jgi:hypothetical protein
MNKLLATLVASLFVASTAFAASHTGAAMASPATGATASTTTATVPAATDAPNAKKAKKAKKQQGQEGRRFRREKVLIRRPCRPIAMPAPRGHFS